MRDIISRLRAPRRFPVSPGPVSDHLNGHALWLPVLAADWSPWRGAGGQNRGMTAIDLASGCSSCAGITVGQTALIAFIAAAVGAAAAMGAAFLVARWARADALADRRRAAYDAFIGSHDELHRLLNVPGASRVTNPDMTFGALLGGALGATSRAYASVVLVGSDAVVSFAREWQKWAWEPYGWFYQASDSPPMSIAEVGQKLEQRRPKGEAFADEFRQAVRCEVAGESGGWRRLLPGKTTR
jgi:hypothetical protein